MCQRESDLLALLVRETEYIPGRHGRFGCIIEQEPHKHKHTQQQQQQQTQPPRYQISIARAAVSSQKMSSNYSFRLPADHNSGGFLVVLNDSSERLAFFGDDDVLRTQHNYYVLAGRLPCQEVRGYPSLSTPVPARTSLEEICKQYPNHVSGRMLLVFAAAGWSTKQIWAALPPAFKLVDPLRPDDDSPSARRLPYRYLHNLTKEQKLAAVREAGGRALEDQLNLLNSAGSSSGSETASVASRSSSMVCVSGSP